MGSCKLQSGSCLYSLGTGMKTALLFLVTYQPQQAYLHVYSIELMLRCCFAGNIYFYSSLFYSNQYNFLLLNIRQLPQVLPGVFEL
jgi:hypothetical protein